MDYDDEEIEAYEDEYDDNDSEKSFEEESDYGDFTEYNPENEFVTGFKQLEHIGYGDVDAVGLNITGDTKLQKAQKILQYEVVAKDKQYLNLKLRPSLLKVFGDDNQDLVSNYMYNVTKIPRFEFKNSDALAAALYLLHFNTKGVNASILKTYSEKLLINSADLYRYYKLVKTYI